MTKLPQGWVECELKDISEYKKGKKPKVLYNEQNNNLLPYIDIKCFEKKIIENYANQSDGILIDDSYILIVWDGARAGFCGESLDKGILGSTLMALKVINMNKNFVSYFIKSKFQILNKKTKGTGIPHVNPEYFWKLKIYVPPLNEQKRIVEKIEKEFENIDKGIEYLSRAKERIKQYRQSVLKSAFEGKLTKQNYNDETAEILLKRINPKADYIKANNLPMGWIECKLKDIVSILGDGIHGTPKYTEEGQYYFINGNNLNDGIIQIKNDTKKISDNEYQKYKKDLNETTILVSINGTIGNTAFYNNEKIILGKSACYFNLQSCINKKFIRYLLKTNYFLNYANVNATGSTIKNVSLKSMRNFTIPLPPLNEQKRIVEEIEKRFKIADEIEKIVDNSLEKAKQLKQSILKKAFEGRLVPQDPADEPASKLLERIKQERKINDRK